MFFSGYESFLGMSIASFFFGATLGIDNPTRNSFIPELIKKEHIGSGIALNGAMVMSAQAIGPFVAGCFLIFFSAGWAFALSGVTTLAVVLTLPHMKVKPIEKKPQEHPVKTFLLGIKYTFYSEPKIRLCAILAGLIGAFGFSYRGILPTLAKEVYKSGPEVVGYLAFAAGCGSLAGAVFVSSKSKNLKFKKLIILGCFTSGISFIVFSTTSNLIIGMALLFLAGLGFTLSFSTLRAVSQIESTPEMRGRVTGLTMMLFFGGVSVGNFMAGLIAKSFGCSASMASCGISFLILAFFIFVFKGK
jgi:MFS family permease